MALIVEIRHGGEWRELGRVGPGDPPGSISHNGPGGRQVYRFGCHGAHSFIERARGGVDVEFGVLRRISTDGFEQIARLDAANPSTDFWVKTDRMREPHRIRWRHEDGDA